MFKAIIRCLMNQTSLLLQIFAYKLVNNVKVDQHINTVGLMHWKELLTVCHKLMILRRGVPVFDFKGVFLVDSVHVYNRTDFEDGVKLYRHAETTKHHVSVTVLGAECLVGDFKTWGAVDGAVNPGYLQTERNSLQSTNFAIFTNTYFTAFVLTAMWLWSFGTLTKVGRRLLNHMVTSRFMLTAKGSNPS